jgi:hypothetical protein
MDAEGNYFVFSENSRENLIEREMRERYEEDE